MEIFAILLVLLLPGGIGAYIIFHGWLNWQQAEAARHWRAVEGRIVASRVVVTKGTKGVTFYEPTFVYEYTVGSRIYRGERIAFGASAREERDEAESIVARSPPGSTAEVYYDPAFPGESVLDRAPQTGEYLAHFAAGAAFILVPLGIVACALTP